MKKIMASMLLVGLVGSASAQEDTYLGDLSAGELTALGVVGAATVAAVVNANRSDSDDGSVQPPPPQCEGADEFNADLGACVGTTNTVTVTGTGTNTTTVTVPVTFTYAPAQ